MSEPAWLPWLSRMLIEQSFTWPPPVSFDAWRAARRYQRRLARTRAGRRPPRSRRG